MKEAEFPEGNDAWLSFLSQNLKTNVPLKNDAPAGVYKVVISFVIDTNGKVIDVKPETNFGYGMEDEAVRVIKKVSAVETSYLIGRSAKRLSPPTGYIPC